MDKEVYFMFLLEGLGDNIARLPALKYATIKRPDVKITAWVPDYFKELVLKTVPKVKVKTFSEVKSAKSGVPTIGNRCTHHTTLRSHIVDTQFALTVDAQVSSEFKEYLWIDARDISTKKFCLPSRYVVITAGFTAPARAMTKEAIAGIMSFLNKRSVTPVLLGASKILARDDTAYFVNFPEINSEKLLDLRNKTSLVEAAAVMAGAKAVIGIDNGLLHLAAMTSTAIVAGFTNVNPIFRKPYGSPRFYTVVPDPEIASRFEQSESLLDFTHDFRLPKNENNEAARNLTADKFTKVLNRII